MKPPSSGLAAAVVVLVAFSGRLSSELVSAVAIAMAMLSVCVVNGGAEGVGSISPPDGISDENASSPWMGEDESAEVSFLVAPLPISSSISVALPLDIAKSCANSLTLSSRCICLLNKFL